MMGRPATEAEHAEMVANRGKPGCEAQRDYYCTRPDGHAGPHVATTSDSWPRVVHTWSDDE